MNVYICFYQGKRYEVLANSSYGAQKKCAAENKIKNGYEIGVVLAEKDGIQVIHKPSF